MSAPHRIRSEHPRNLASLIRGLYGRVARRLRVDPSYVSRVARGERQSGEVENALEQELRKIMSMVKRNPGVASRGTGRSSGRKPKKLTKRK